MLVPEIALTPQTVARFQARFGDTVALLHSALGEGERYDEWRRLRTGEARIAVGPRSAVFAPVADLGLIVVDEEHDAPTSTRATRATTPAASPPSARAGAGAALLGRRRRRRARRLARAARTCALPDARRRAAAAARARARHARRAASAAPADAPRARRRAQVDRAAQPPRLVELPHLPRRAGRRGSARSATSRSCCTAPSTRSPATTAATASACPSAATPAARSSVARYGVGTERIEAELARGARRAGVPARRRHGGDQGRRPRAARRASTPRRPGVLLGTQMVAKGHDFPDVTLGVVLDADSTLRFPDFRAEERTFALIAQLAGRAGRGPQGGRVLVQTTAPDAPAIEAAARHDADGLPGRRARAPARAALPAVRRPHPRRRARPRRPSRRAPRRRGGRGDRRRARASASEILGPAPLFRLRGRERRQVVVKTTERAAAIRATAAAVEAAARDRALRDVAFSVDVDPQ